jgi:hypothetical protein
MTCWISGICPFYLSNILIIKSDDLLEKTSVDYLSFLCLPVLELFAI